MPFLSDEYVIVGGTREEGNFNTDVVPQVQDDILQRAAEVLPQVKVGAQYEIIRPVDSQFLTL